MGSNTSKQSAEAAVPAHKNNPDDATNPDPRSPTPEIVRTPLQGKGGAKHNITKNVDLRKTFEESNDGEKLILNNPILSAVIKNHLQFYDPRSPTQDFERTPIVLASIVDDDSTTDPKLLSNFGSPCLTKDDDDNSCDSCNEAVDSPDPLIPRNLCNGFYDMTINETINDTDEPLGSSTESKEAIEVNTSDENSKLPTKLLETNFDYTEADNEIFEDTEENIQTSPAETDNIKHVSQFRILNVDPRSPSTGIERTPIVLPKIESINPPNVEDMSDDTLIKVLQNANTELRQTVNKTQDNPEGLLIYEDEGNVLNDTPKKSKSVSIGNASRTPLSCVKNKDGGHTRSKSANTLQDCKNQKVLPSKVQRKASHIPRLKSLSKQTKLHPSGSTISLKNISDTGVSGDCENTPPHSHRDRWDKDSSIIL